MTDLTILNLYDVMYDSKQLAKLHELQLDRCSEHELTQGARPKSMRLSCTDPVRRVKAFLDSWWASTIDDGLGARGHWAEDYLEVALFHGGYAPLAGKLYGSQVAIQWHEHGRSAFDWVVANHGGGDRVVSCKSKDPKDKTIASCKPSAANLAQERRMMALAGYPAESVFEVWMVDPSTMRAAGPHEHTLDQEHIDAARAELDGVTRALSYFAKLDDPTRSPHWNDPVAWRELFSLESTSAAFKLPRLDANGAVEARVRAERRAAEKLAIAKHEHAVASDLLFQRVDEQLELLRETDPNAKSVIAYSGDDIVHYGRKSNGAKQVTVKPAPPADTATAA